MTIKKMIKVGDKIFVQYQMGSRLYKAVGVVQSCNEPTKDEYLFLDDVFEDGKVHMIKYERVTGWGYFI